MKYIVWTIVLLVVAILLGVWIRNTPKESVEQQQIPVDTVPEVEQSSTPAPTPSQEASKPSSIRTIKGMNIETKTQGSGAAIANGQIAVVHYTGTLTNGTVFDSSKNRGVPFEFTLGEGRVIQGWELGVLGMKVGEVRMLTIPPELAYGSQAVGGVIPANATLVFEVELVGIK